MRVMSSLPGGASSRTAGHASGARVPRRVASAAGGGGGGGGRAREYLGATLPRAARAGRARQARRGRPRWAGDRPCCVRIAAHARARARRAADAIAELEERRDGRGVDRDRARVAVVEEGVERRPVEVVQPHARPRARPSRRPPPSIAAKYGGARRARRGARCGARRRRRRAREQAVVLGEDGLVVVVGDGASYRGRLIGGRAVLIGVGDELDVARAPAHRGERAWPRGPRPSSRAPRRRGTRRARGGVGRRAARAPSRSAPPRCPRPS